MANKDGGVPETSKLEKIMEELKQKADPARVFTAGDILKAKAARQGWAGPQYEQSKQTVGAFAHLGLGSASATTAGRPLVEEKDMKDWAGGAKRSKAMPPWNMLQWKALKGILTRFSIGMKYGLNNWRKALSTGATMDLDAMRKAWHDGEPGPGLGAEDNSALGFIRQFVAHAQEHYTNAVELVDKPVGAQSEKGDDLMANLFAYGWNVLCLIEYAIENEDMVREALSQYPEGHPKRRQDLKGLTVPEYVETPREHEAQNAMVPLHWQLLDPSVPFLCELANCPSQAHYRYVGDLRLMGASGAYACKEHAR